MDFDDPRWAQLQGGYRVPYDPRKALLTLERNDRVKEAWRELWNGLHHQGDVGEASYAAVPHLVRIHSLRGIADDNTYALAAIIEEARHHPQNPPLPTELSDAYETAWRDLIKLGLRDLGEASDPTLVRSILAVLAMGKGQTTLGRLAIAFTEDEIREMIEAAGY